MKKQAITFLSLFTLILVLSIYYLLVPPEQNANVQVSSREATQIEKLQVSLDKSHKTEMTKYNDIIASSKSTHTQIEQALVSLNKTKEIMNKEKDIVSLLKKNGYKECFVEINDQHIKAVVHKNNSNSQDANQIIRLIRQKMNTNIDIEVKFVAQ